MTQTRHWSFAIPSSSIRRGKAHMADSIDQWLETLELGRYAQAFIDNEIGIRDLPFIQEADLVELGLPIGPRRRVMHAISELR